MNKNRKSGQGLVEMAFVLPLFIFLLLGIIDFGRALHCWSSINYQCVQAARVATKRKFQLIGRDLFRPDTHTPLVDVQKAFWDARSPMTPQADFTEVKIEGVGTTDKNVRVMAKFKLELFTPAAGILVGSGGGSGNTVTLAAAAQERKE